MNDQKQHYKEKLQKIFEAALKDPGTATERIPRPAFPPPPKPQAYFTGPPVTKPAPVESMDEEQSEQVFVFVPRNRASATPKPMISSPSPFSR